MLEVEIIFAEGLFSPKEREFIGRRVTEALERTVELLALEGSLTVEVREADSGSWWVSGAVHRKDLISLEVPHGISDGVGVRQTTHHELHHVARGHTLDAPSSPIIDTIFGEGLAVAFEEMQEPGHLVYCADYAGLPMELVMRHLRQDMWTMLGGGTVESLSPSMRFFFDQRYRIGKYLVDQIFERHPTHTPVSLVRTDTKELVELSGVFE